MLTKGKNSILIYEFSRSVYSSTTQTQPYNESYLINNEIAELFRAVLKVSAKEKDINDMVQHQTRSKMP